MPFLISTGRHHQLNPRWPPMTMIAEHSYSYKHYKCYISSGITLRADMSTLVSTIAHNYLAAVNLFTNHLSVFCRGRFCRARRPAPFWWRPPGLLKWRPAFLKTWAEHCLSSSASLSLCIYSASWLSSVCLLKGLQHASPLAVAVLRTGKSSIVAAAPLLAARFSLGATAAAHNV